MYEKRGETLHDAVASRDGQLRGHAHLLLLLFLHQTVGEHPREERPESFAVERQNLSHEEADDGEDANRGVGPVEPGFKVKLRPRADRARGDVERAVRQVGRHVLVREHPGGDDNLHGGGERHGGPEDLRHRLVVTGRHAAGAEQGVLALVVRDEAKQRRDG